MNRVRLLVLNAALGPLDYRVPDGMDVKPGSVVSAPLGPRQISGIVWEAERLPATTVPDERLRPLLGLLPVPAIRAELRRLVEWTADYYCAPLAAVARMVGLSRQTTNQILQELQQAGWLQLRRGKLEVLDLAALKAAALTGQIPTSS